MNILQLYFKNFLILQFTLKNEIPSPIFNPFKSLQVPDITSLYNEDTLVKSLISFLVFSVAFLIPIGQVSRDDGLTFQILLLSSCDIAFTYFS